MRKAFLAVLLLLLPNMLAAQQQTLNNDSVIRMTQTGLSEEVIISTINTSPGFFNTSVDGLIALQSAGVSEKVIEAMLAKAATPVAKTRTTESPSVRQLETWDSENDDLKQKFRAGMKFMFGDDCVYYGPSVGGLFKNIVGFELGMLTTSDSVEYYDAYGGSTSRWTARVYAVTASGLFTVANINAGGLYVQPYVGGGVNFAFSTGDASSYYDGTYKVGGQGIFGAQFTAKAVRRLSFGPEFGYYRIMEGKGWLAGLTVNFNIF